MILSRLLTGFPGDSVVKNPPAKVGASGDVSSVLESGRSPGGGNGNPPQYSCLGNPMDRGAWWDDTVHRGSKSQMQLSTQCRLLRIKSIRMGKKLKDDV